MYDKIIEIGIIVLLVYTPLAFGGVTQPSITFLEIVSGVLLLVWLAKRTSQRRNIPQKTEHFPVMIYGFFVVIVLQCVPLPGSFVKMLSPATYQSYHEGTVYTGLPFPNWLPLSVCSQATEEELYKYLAYGIIFFMIVQTIRTRRQVNRLVFSILAVGLLEALYGFTKFLRIASKSGVWVHGTFVNKNHFAGYMEMVILLALGVFFTRFETPGSAHLKLSVDAIREKYPKAFLMLLGILIMISAQVLSGSRGGISSLSFGILCFALLASSRRLLRRWVVILLFFLPIVVGATALMSPNILVQALKRFTGLQFEQSFLFRWELWKSAAHIFRDFPIIGSGLGTFTHLGQRYRTFREQLQHYQYAENDYLQFLAESGIIGMSLLLISAWMFLSATFVLWKQRHSRWTVALSAGGMSALFSIVIHSVTDFNLHIPSNALLFTVVAALSSVTVHIKDEGKRRKVKCEREGKDGEWRMAKGEREETEGRRQEAEDYIQHSTFNIQHLMLFVFVCFYLFRVSESFYAFEQYQRVADVISAEQPLVPDAKQDQSVISHLTNAIRHDRNNAEYVYALGSYLYQRPTALQPTPGTPAEVSQFDEAERWLYKAVMLNPANPWYYYELGRLSDKRRDCQVATSAHFEGGLQLSSCPTTLYFSAALRNAPNEMFLRDVVKRWYSQYDPEGADRFLHQILEGVK
jgi:O-antigen ligase